MTIDAGQRRWFTVPNLVSFARILLVGVFWWLWADQRASEAAWLLAVMAATDWLDGWLARRLDQVSALGAVLDPLGDGLMMMSAIVGGMARGWVPVLPGVLVLARSVAVAGWSGVVTTRTGKTIAVRTTGKVAITLLFVAVPAFYWAVGATGALRVGLETIAWATAAVGLVFHWWSGMEYLRDGWSMIRRAGRRSPRR